MRRECAAALWQQLIVPILLQILEKMMDRVAYAPCLCIEIAANDRQFCTVITALQKVDHLFDLGYASQS